MIRTLRAGAALIALLAAATAAEAQGGGGGGGARGGGGGRGGPGGITMLMQGITVDAGVQAKIDSLTAAFTAAQTKLRTDLGLPAQMGRGGGGGGDTPPPDPAKMAEFQTKNTEMTNKLRNDVKALLNADQQKAFDTNLANMPQGRGRGRGGE